MNGARRFWIVGGSLLLLGMVPAQGARDDAPQRMLRGHILDAASGLAVEHAAVYLASARLGTRTNGTGAFVIMGVPDVGEPLELTIEHPCFHTVRVVIEDRGDVSVGTGLPFRASEAGASDACLAATCGSLPVA